MNLVKNNTAIEKEKTFQSIGITTNIKGLTRNDTMEGRDYLVVPMVMLVEGVHNGNQGPIFYPAKEIKKFPQVWNHKPVVVYHPEGSACDSAILTNRKIGVIMNTKYSAGKLKAEAWIDVERAEKVDERVLTAIRNGEMMELSTGLFMEVDEEAGSWNGEDYVAIAKNFGPDHLAVLPDQKGACSIEDGAGFLRLNAEKNSAEVKLEGISKEQLGLLTEKLADKSLLNKLMEYVENELSFDDIRTALYLAMKNVDATPGMDVWVETVYSSHFIFQRNGKYFKQDYTEKKGKVTLKGVPTEVQKEINYVTVNERKVMDKKSLVDGLIANAATQWVEADRDALMAMNEETLTKMSPVENKETQKASTEPAKAPVANAEAAPETVESFISKAPSEIGAMLSYGLNSYNTEKAKLVATLVANKKNSFTQTELMAKNVDELSKLVGLCIVEQKPQPRFDAAGGGAGPVDNAHVEEPLPIPTMNFEKK